MHHNNTMRMLVEHGWQRIESHWASNCGGSIDSNDTLLSESLEVCNSVDRNRIDWPQEMALGVYDDSSGHFLDNRASFEEIVLMRQIEWPHVFAPSEANQELVAGNCRTCAQIGLVYNYSFLEYDCLRQLEVEWNIDWDQTVQLNGIHQWRWQKDQIIVSVGIARVDNQNFVQKLIRV